MDYNLIIDSFIGPYAYSKTYVRSILAGQKGKHVDVKISSLGGDLGHGLDIRQQFLDHGDVTVYLSGCVASAATVIALGAKRIVISKYALFLVHKCSNFIDAWGSYNADQMQALIDELEANKKENDKIDVVLAQMYADKCKKKVSEILDILKEGRWLTAQEAYDLGFVDEISDSFGEKLNFTPAMGEKFNALGLSTLGLNQQPPTPAPKQEDEPVAEHANQSPSPTKMKDHNFKTVGELLKLDAITPDADGYVSVTAEQFEEINNRLESIEKEASEKSAAVSAKDEEISKLNEQIENLKKAPGDETPEIKDDEKTDSVSSASVLFNSIKSAL